MFFGGCLVGVFLDFYLGVLESYFLLVSWVCWCFCWFLRRFCLVLLGDVWFFISFGVGSS